MKFSDTIHHGCSSQAEPREGLQLACPHGGLGHPVLDALRFVDDDTACRQSSTLARVEDAILTDTIWTRLPAMAGCSEALKTHLRKT